MPRLRERKRGLSEEVVYVLNPLPDVEDAELLKRAGLALATPATESPFRMTWQFGSGLERETVTLDPGERALLRSSEAAEFMETFREQGAVVLPLECGEAEVAKHTADGLRRAQKFYRDRGAARVKDYQKTHGLSKEELEDHRYETWAWHHNQAKADVIEESLRRVLSAPKKGAAAKA